MTQKGQKKLWVFSSTHEIVMKKCVAEFRRHHPELDSEKITQNFIVLKIAEFYLKA